MIDFSSILVSLFTTRLRSKASDALWVTSVSPESHFVTHHDHNYQRYGIVMTSRDLGDKTDGIKNLNIHFLSLNFILKLIVSNYTKVEIRFSSIKK